MKAHWRKIYSLLPSSIEKKGYKNYFKKLNKKWLTLKKPLPVSHLYKQNVLLNFVKKFDLHTLVETGTYLGDMLYTIQDYFNELYSIELSELYYKQAVNRFKNNKKIHLILGNSGKELKTLIPNFNTPVLFWLDGHYSGGKTAKGDKECPVYEELEAIFESEKQHVIVIDDARLFVGKNDYPTIEDLEKYIKQKRPSYNFSIDKDIIQIYP